MRASVAKPLGLVASIVGITVAMGTAGCSTGSGDPPGQPGTHTSAQHKPGRIGDTLSLTRAEGGTVAVTLNRVISPVTVVGDKADPTRRYLAVELTITDTGSTDAEGTVLVSVTLGASDNQTYQADLNDVGECENFDEGTFHLLPGESATGCVVFALPDGVSPTSVRYVPSAGFADDYGEWVVS